MGNSIVSSVVKMFDRRNLEIDSISAKIYREQINGCHEKHEVYVENIGIYRTNLIENSGDNGNQIQVHTHTTYTYIPAHAHTHLAHSSE